MLLREYSDISFHVCGCKGEFNQYIKSKPKKLFFHKYCEKHDQIYSQFDMEDTTRRTLTKQKANFSQLFILCVSLPFCFLFC